jgi:nucleoside-diphosphate-sugar epimerase
MTRVLVTGSTGFIGREFCELLSQRGYRIRAALRVEGPTPSHIREKIVIGEIGRLTQWSRALEGVDCVAHCAALAHVLGDQSASVGRYMETNAYGTERLALACIAARVKRFVFLSSVKVNGERTDASAFSPIDTPNPSDAYAQSKMYAEARLQEIAASAPMQLAIVRPPLVYGPYVRGNFLRLMNLVDRQWPLPLGAVRNCRSMVSVWNLCDLLERLLRGAIPKSAVFMVSDAELLSTTEVIRQLGAALGRSTTLIPVPLPLLRAMSVLVGRQGEFARLCESLVVDTTSTMEKLQWRPPFAAFEGFARTAHWYRAARESA